MKQLVPIVVACIASWAVVVLAGAAAKEVFFGMLGPLVAVAVSWLVTERAHRLNPVGVGQLLVAAFAVKMLFFGGYIAVATQVLRLELVAFTTSFVVYFIALYVVQAVLMRNLTLRHAS